MLKKSFTFSLLAVGLMIAPTTAFTEQFQTNVQKPIAAIRLSRSVKPGSSSPRPSLSPRPVPRPVKSSTPAPSPAQPRSQSR
ncbi:hypothetical protein NIES2130_31960 [Scytonema sp. HK-05]|nr:hypothetical protein NIES2130_31960 [Scytonema sp. HK-05]